MMYLIFSKYHAHWFLNHENEDNFFKYNHIKNVFNIVCNNNYSELKLIFKNSIFINITKLSFSG